MNNHGQSLPMTNWRLQQTLCNREPLLHLFEVKDDNKDSCLCFFSSLYLHNCQWCHFV